MDSTEYHRSAANRGFTCKALSLNDLPIVLKAERDALVIQVCDQLEIIISD